MRPFSISIDPQRPKRPKLATSWRLAPVVLASVIAASAGAQGYGQGGYGYPPGQGGQDYGQPVDPSGNPLGDPGNAALGADPSSRVATLTDVGGNVSFAPAGSDTWAATGLNRPVTTGDRLWVDPGGRAELHAGSTAVRLAGATAVSVLNLDDDTTQVKLTQGTLQLRVRALPQGQTVEVDTPNLAFVPSEPGDYRLDVAPDGSTTTVTMRHGRAVLYGDSRSTELERGERVRFAGTDLADAGAGNLAPTDAFDRWTADRDAREDRSVAAQYVPRDMTGYTALDDYGDWQQDADYGAVWFPRAVSPGWAPYSVGQWAWVAPWGWTWVDDAPWGFAPSHYGRWAHVGNRWGWVPGPANVRPYYAPAVVGFIGSSTQIRIGGGPGVAWYPLGPGERYRPIYRSSPTYLTRINYGARDWNGRGDRDRWFNRGVPGAITGMPARGFVEGRPSAPYRAGGHNDEWRRIPGGEAHGGPAIAPVKTSLIGGAPVRNLPPQARQTFDREAIAARAPGFVRSDDLARRFAREGGTAGAGPAWRGPQVPDARQPGRSPQPVASYSDVRVSQAAQHPRDRQSWQQGQPGRSGQPQGFVSAPGAADNGRTYSTRPDQMRGLPAEAQRQQQALQRQQFEQQRQLQEQQRQGPDFQRQQQQALQRQQFEQQRQLQEQQRQGPDFQRQQQQALQRQQFEQQRQLQEQQRQGSDFQRQQQQALQRQQMEQQRQLGEQQAAGDRARQDQQRAFTQQRQQQDEQRAAMQRAQMEQQRAQDMQRQQQDQQRAAMQRAQMDQQRAQDMQRQQQDQQRAAMQRAQQEQQRAQDMQRQQQDQQRAAMQRAQQEQQRAFEQQRQQQDQQRQAMQRAQQEQQRAQMEQQRQQSMQRQQMEQQRQAQEQQRQAFEQQRQQQQHQQQQQQQQQRQFQQQRGQQARNEDRR
ncbi:branched-chain amino acid ABC transporter substrate-binding protein [Cupriavidus pauculus]|uniref:Branched-chain amino acid ABC transporter substrate-binding protein n=1 Tax=Cupriavidus pauculus TaxID=82633 RepID=A0A5P2H9U0_9BURK|nr:DUF6600 domain-containing protein [Cupriavidus pauculus]QET04977.1 branched-chain amino acid ABC transporter substrate-binding protein [Cupriavidus pauculus]